MTDSALRRSSRYLEILICVALFAAAFLIRAQNLDALVTVDEPRWVDRSVRFLDYLTQADWTGMVHVLGLEEFNHPGVTTMWTGSLGVVVHYLPELSLHGSRLFIGEQPLREAVQDSMALLATMRYPTVFLAALFSVLIYLLLRKSLGWKTALVGSLLISFDPFFVALSRILHHDALQSIFALVAVICLGLAWERRRWSWFLAAGGAIGLAFLSKSLAIILIPYSLATAAVAMVVLPGSCRTHRTLLLGVLGCWGAAAVTIFALWPALWGEPVQALKMVYNLVMAATTSPHESMSFFWGEPVQVPSPFFYLVALLYRGSPSVQIGAVLSAGPLIWSIKEGDRRLRFWILLLWGLVAAYVLPLSIGSKKFDRYALAAFLALDLLAAIGWVAVLEKLGRWLNARRRWLVGAGLGCIVIAQVVLCLRYAPYFLSYYNPVLAAVRPPEETLLVGWGEGLDQVVDYLDAKENAGSLILSTDYETLAKFLGFKGQVEHFPPKLTGDKPRYPLAQSDYVCLYSDRLQANPMPPALYDYFVSDRPEFVARKNGIEYAWLYEVDHDRYLALPDAATQVDVEFPNGLRLAGFEPFSPSSNGDGSRSLPVKIYWQVERACVTDYRLLLELVDDKGKVWISDVSYPPWGPADCNESTTPWHSDLIYPHETWLDLAPDISPGRYHVEASIIHEPDQNPVNPSSGQSPARLNRFELSALD